MRCPQCQGTTAEYCTINDRFALCPPCTERVRVEFTELTGATLAKGVAAGAAVAFGVSVVANVIQAIFGGGTLVVGLAAIFMGSMVGRTARKWSRAGGLLLQLATVGISLVAVLEMFAGLVYASARA